MSDGAFSRRGAGILAAVAAASLAAAGFLGAFGDALYDPPTSGPDSFSRSAVGHHAAVALLRAMGWQVVVSRHRTPDRARQGAVVALLEPRVGPDDAAGRGRLQAIDRASRRLLVVLPKRDAIPDPARPRFVAYADPLPVGDAQRVLDLLNLEGTVVRSEKPDPRWRGELSAPSLERPQLVKEAIASREDRAAMPLRPLLATDEGILVGELELPAVDEDDEEDLQEEPYRTIVVADPDLLETHGLGKGDNAAVLVRVLERLGAAERTVVVDETLHGLEEQPSLARALLRFPLVLATVSALVAAALLAWAALVRFGGARPPEPVLSPGKLFLVESTAALLRHGGRAPDAAVAYLRAAKDEVIQRLRPPGETAAGDAWLARTAAARGQDGTLVALEDRVKRLAQRGKGGEDEAVRLARDIHQWREEMTDGARTDPRHHGRAAG